AGAQSLRDAVFLLGVELNSHAISGYGLAGLLSTGLCLSAPSQWRRRLSFSEIPHGAFSRGERNERKGISRWRARFSDALHNMKKPQRREGDTRRFCGQLSAREDAFRFVLRCSSLVSVMQAGNRAGLFGVAPLVVHSAWNRICVVARLNGAE